MDLFKRDAHSIDRIQSISKSKRPWNVGWLVLRNCVISWVNEWEDYSNDFGEGVRISWDWATTLRLAFMVGLRTVMEPEGMSFSMLMRVNHHWWFNHAYVIELPQKSWMIQYSESSGLVNTCTCSKSGILQIQWAQEVSALEVLPDLGLCASSSALFFLSFMVIFIINWD